MSSAKTATSSVCPPKVSVIDEADVIQLTEQWPE
jgi:hypothetical protein